MHTRHPRTHAPRDPRSASRCSMVMAPESRAPSKHCGACHRRFGQCRLNHAVVQNYESAGCSSGSWSHRLESGPFVPYPCDMEWLSATATWGGCCRDARWTRGDVNVMLPQALFSRVTSAQKCVLPHPAIFFRRGDDENVPVLQVRQTRLLFAAVQAPVPQTGVP